MAENVVNVGVLVKTTGLKEGVDQSAQFANNMEKVNTAATKASKAIAASGKAAATASNATNAPTGVSTVTDKDYAKVRGAVGTGAAGRDFAKQAQGLGGLVALYATFAANIFAVGAAYEALNKAAQVERLAKATELMSSQVGVNLKSVSKNLVEASGHALSFAEAMQFTNIGTSAGLAGKQVENLTKIAKGAAIALGRDVGDSVRRIIQGTAKQEQEILDELGIFVKSKQAFDKYADAIGVKVDALTGTQRTQAYANEVERLGKKWEQFAEIDDPFSRFTATGKNALNDLLAGVNSLFTPLLSFLAQSKEGIQGIIVLVATMLSKRALPELGNMLNNIFTFDKQVAINKAIEARSAIGKELAALEKQALDTKKAMESIKIGPTTSETISSGLGVIPYVKGGPKDISATKLANTFNKDPAAFLTIAEAEKTTLNIMREQLKVSKSKDILLSSLIEKGRLEAGSTLDKLVLDEKGKAIAVAMNAKANEAIGLERQKITLAEINLAIEEKTLALKKAGGALTNQQNTLSKLGTAKNAINTAASEGSRAIDAAIPQGFGPFNTKTFMATIDAIKGVWTASKAASVGLSGMATASLLASTATNILGIALKGALAFLGPLAMALMTAYTVWSIFGETIKEYLPNWAKVLMGWDEGSKKAEAAKEKLDEYNKSLGYSAAQLQMLNEIRAKGFESVDEEARYADTLLKNIISTTEAYKKYTEEKQTAANEDRLEAARKAGGKGFSEDAYWLRQMTEAYKDLVPQETITALKVLADNMSISTRHMAEAKKGTEEYSFWENRLNGYIAESARLRNEVALPAAQKDAASKNEAANATTRLSKAYEELHKKQSKLVDPSAQLNSTESKQYYADLITLLESSSSSGQKVSTMFDLLKNNILLGGKALEVTLPLWTEFVRLQELLGRPEMGIDPKTQADALATWLSSQKGTLAGISALHNGTVKAAKVPKEYSDVAKQAIKQLSDQIDYTSDSIELLDRTFKNTSAIDARNQKLRGYTTELEAVAAQTYANEKADLEYAKKMQEAAKEYANQVLKTSATPETKADALEKLKREQKNAENLKKQANDASEIAKANDDIATKQALITKEYDKQKKDMDASTKAKEDSLELDEMYLDLANASLDLTVEQKALLLEQSAIKKAMYAREDAQNKARLEYEYAINQVMASGATDEIALKEKIDTILADRNAKIEAADTEYNKTVTKAGITTLTTIAEESKKTSDTIRDSLTDAFMDSFENGTNIFENLKNSIKSMFNNMVLRPIIQAGVGGAISAFTGNALSGAAGSATGSTFTNALSSQAISSGLKSMFPTATAAMSEFTTAAVAGTQSMIGLTGTAAQAQAAANYGIAQMTGASTTAASAGSALATATPYIAAALAIYSIAKGTKGETRAGGQYGYSTTGTEAPNPRRGGTIGASDIGAVFLEGPSGGDPYAKEVKTGINATVEGINTIFKDLGSIIKVTGFQAAYETSGKGRGGVLAGGTLSTGATFGESGSGDNYAGTLYEKTSTTSPDAATALANFSTDLMQATVQALQAATDIPTTIADMLKGVDAESLSQEEVTTLLTTISNVTAAVNEFNKVVLTLPFENLKNLSFDTATALVEVAGGFDILGANLATYYDNFYSEEEKRAQTITNITRVLKDAGATVTEDDVKNSNREAFKDIVESQDLTTESGRELYTALLSVSGAFAELFPIVDDTEEAAAKLETTLGLNIEILNLLGRSNEALLLTRQKELDALSDTDKVLQQTIYNLEDINAYAEATMTPTQKLNKGLFSIRKQMKDFGDTSNNSAETVSLYNKAIKTSGVSYIDNMTSFDKLVRSIDTTTSSGMALQTAVMRVGTAFSGLVDEVTNLVSGITKSIDSSIFSMQYNLQEDPAKYEMLDTKADTLNTNMRLAGKADDIYGVATYAQELVETINSAWSLLSKDQQTEKFAEYSETLNTIKEYVTKEGADTLALKRVSDQETADTISEATAAAIKTAMEPVVASLVAASTSIDKSSASMSDASSNMATTSLNISSAATTLESVASRPVQVSVNSNINVTAPVGSEVSIY